MSDKQVTIKCKVGSVLTTESAQKEADLESKKQAINLETESEICEFLGARDINKAKEVQLNANNEVTDLLTIQVSGGELSKNELARLNAIREIGRGVKELLAKGQAKKELL